MPRPPSTADHTDGPSEHEVDSLDQASRWRRTWATLAGVGIGGMAYFLILLDFSWSPGRRATGSGYASQFFDLQAQALRDGHLWLPKGSLGIEGFVVDGRTHMYFGLFPALLRVPVQLITNSYDGQLSLVSMAAAWVVLAVMTTRMYWLIRDLLGTRRQITRVDAVLAAVFLAVVTGGSVITFDASLPWVYHEVYLWAVATVVGSLYWLLRAVVAPRPSTFVWLTVFAVAAALTRMTGGLAVCIGVLAAGAWVLLGRVHRHRRRDGIWLVAAGLLPLAASSTINFLRFRHLFMFPLQDQVWTQVNEHRRMVLAANNDSLVGLQFFASSFINYFRPDGVRFVSYFPWITLPGDPARGYGAELDQSYRTGSLPGFMPLLLVLTVIGLLAIIRLRADHRLRAVQLVATSALLVCAGVMAYGYLAYRYTSEFMPVLIVGGAIGTHTVAGWVARRERLIRIVVPAAALLAAYSILANVATGYAVAASTYRGERLESYLSRQLDVSGDTAAYAGLVRHSERLPGQGRADDLWIRGDCQALYFNTGETNEPWVLVEERDTTALVKVADDAPPSWTLLMRSSSDKPREVWFEMLPDHQARVVLRNETGDYNGQVFDLPPQAQVRVGARNRSELGFAEVASTPGGYAGFVQTFDWDADWISQPGYLQHASDTDLRGPGIRVVQEAGLPLTLCQRIAKAARIDVRAD